MNNPSSLSGLASSKLEIQLQFLAKELELERIRREKLQKQVEDMQQQIELQKLNSETEEARNRLQKEKRESAMKRLNMDVESWKVQEKGFVLI